jgi:hypothetical protein
MFVFTVLGRLKGNAGYLGVFGYAPIALMHHRFVKAQIALLGEAGVPTGFHWAEWIVLVLGGGFWCLGLIGILLPPSPGEFAPGERTWFLSCIVLAVVGLVVVAVASRRAIAEGRAMHADPSPERIAPYVQ